MEINKFNGSSKVSMFVCQYKEMYGPLFSIVMTIVYIAANVSLWNKLENRYHKLEIESTSSPQK